MKITKREVTGNNSIRILFATNRQELELLYGISQKALVLFPCVPNTEIEHERLRMIINNFKRTLENWDKIPIENEIQLINEKSKP
jgi:hypothetical protein